MSFQLSLTEFEIEQALFFLNLEPEVVVGPHDLHELVNGHVEVGVEDFNLGHFVIRTFFRSDFVNTDGGLFIGSLCSALALSPQFTLSTIDSQNVDLVVKESTLTVEYLSNVR